MFQLKCNVSCGSNCADIGIPAVRQTITLTFRALEVNNALIYLFIYFWPFTSVMIKRRMCLLQMYFAVERVRERWKKRKKEEAAAAS